MDSVSTTFFLDMLMQVDKSPEGQFIQLMALPRTLQQKITKLVDPPGKNRDVEEILLQVAQDPDCGAVVQQGLLLRTHQFIKETLPCVLGTFANLYECRALLFLIENEILLLTK